MIKFLLALFVIGVVVALLVALAALCCTLWVDAIDNLKAIGFEREKDYQRGYERGRLDAVKYPMGMYTFPVACSHCANLNSDKCYRCKEERQSGFEMKLDKEVEQ